MKQYAYYNDMAMKKFRGGCHLTDRNKKKREKGKQIIYFKL